MGLSRKDYGYTLDDILDANNAAAEVEAAYLRQHGWDYTSTLPGCASLWLWRKEIDGRIVAVNRATAIEITRNS